MQLKYKNGFVKKLGMFYEGKTSTILHIVHLENA
jgi:hypothetical protein